MTNVRSITDRIRTVAFLLTGVIQLSLQAGPVAAQASAIRQVDRLLDDLVDDGEIPQEVALQCHLISLVSDAVTLRAATTSTLKLGVLDATPAAEEPRTYFIEWAVHPAVPVVDARTLRSLSQEQPQGP